jgi:hypothetical protein
MHSDHPLADNLFGRLQTYGPREGREPLKWLVHATLDLVEPGELLTQASAPELSA